MVVFLRQKDIDSRAIRLAIYAQLIGPLALNFSRNQQHQVSGDFKISYVARPKNVKSSMAHLDRAILYCSKNRRLKLKKARK